MTTKLEIYEENKKLRLESFDQRVKIEALTVKLEQLQKAGVLWVFIWGFMLVPYIVGWSVLGRLILGLLGVI